MIQLADERFDTELADPAFKEACHQFRETIENQTASACFVCGGSIPVGDSARPDSSSKWSMMSPPVDIFWATGNDSTARKLDLPLTHLTPESGNEVLRQLVADCDPASFGRGQQDIIEYRKAGKLDPHQFATNFYPTNFGIIENVTDILLPNISSKTQNRLPFRKLSAELYKLNIYSGPSGLFRKHVDTPRSENQIGPMVVCIPSPFKGGSLIVQHQGKEVCFDWSAQSDSTIQWAALYSDCEHEIKTITEGERIMLTYNLYVTEPVGAIIPPNVIVEPQTLPP